MCDYNTLLDCSVELTMMADSDSSDEVIKEIDVVLSKPLSRNLYIFQYPVRPKHLSVDNMICSNVKVKPMQKKFELELALNTASSHYSKSKGEQLAINTDNNKSSSTTPYFESGRMDKQFLSSTVANIPAHQYVIGIMQEGELHLLPLTSVLQFRPSFNYLDKSNVSDKDTSLVAEDDMSHDEEEEVKAVQVKFARQETDEAKARRMATYDYLQKKQEEESWLNIRFHARDDVLSHKERDFVLNSIDEQNYSNFSNCFGSIDPMTYLEKLLPKATVLENTKPAMPATVLSMMELKKLPLGDQVKALLINAKILRFSQLISHLPKSSDVSVVLKYVQQVALLVQGNWVVKSEVLYPPNTSSANSGTPAETLCIARDYILWRFCQNRYLMRKDVAQIVKLPSEDLKEILEQLSKMKVHKGWEFQGEYDHDFIRHHSDVCSRQAMVWDAKKQTISTALNVTMLDSTKAVQLQNESTKTSPTRRRKNSTCRLQSIEDTDMNENLGDVNNKRPAELEPSALQAESKSFAKPRQRLSSKHSENGIISDEESGIKIKVTKAKVKKEPVDNAAFAYSHTSSEETSSVMSELELELGKFTANKLSSIFVLSLSDLRQLLTMYIVQCPPGHVLGNVISDQLLTKSVLSIGGICLTLPYISEPVFVWPRGNDQFDHVRSVILDCLQSAQKLRIITLREKLEKSSIVVPSDNELRKLLKDYCVTKGGSWQLKCIKDD